MPRLASFVVLALVSAPLALACSPSANQPEASPIPQRIASRTVLSDEVLWALGEDVQARVVGLSPMVDDPRYSSVADRWPTQVPRLGRNPEELLATGADLVVLASFSDAEYRAALADHTSLLVLEDFSGFAAYLANLEAIGTAVGATPESIAALRERFEARRAALEAARPPLAERPTVIAWDYGHVPGEQTSFDDAATTAGFRNLAREQGLVGHQRLDTEQLIAWDPQWLVIGCGEHSCERARATLIEQPGFEHLRAVRDEHVITIEAPWLGSIGEGMLELSARMQAALLEDSK
ncbi:ABC transporter substrate-binding protein [Nannocystaceae bacterium ST9]